MVGEPPHPRPVLDAADLVAYRQSARAVFADRAVKTYAVRLADATRHPQRYGLPELSGLIEFGASPRASIGLVQAAQALAMLRGRTHVTVADVRDLAADVLRHRLVLSYDALSDEISADDILDRLLGALGGGAEPASSEHTAEHDAA